MTATFRRFKFTYFHGFLLHDGRRYVPGHRFDFNTARLRLTFQETIVYGNRGVEPPYLIPVLVYYFTDWQHTRHANRWPRLFKGSLDKRAELAYSV